MTKFEIKCIDSEGDNLKIEVENGIATFKNSNKFTLPIDGDKLKRLFDTISGMTLLLNDFKLKEISISEEE